MDADAIVVGAGLAGLVATHELTSKGRRVALVGQENAANPGGQAYWSYDGLYAAGEVAGFGGGVHGGNAHEGTFLGGCLCSGRQAGLAAAQQTAG